MRYKETQSPVITLATGPVDAYSQVLHALGRPVLYDYDPAFLGFYQSVVEKLRSALRTRHLPVILHGEPVLALEAGAASLIGSDDVVLNLVSGVYGAGFGFWAKRYCKELLEIRVPYDQVIDPASVAEMLKSRPDITIVSVCHHDTPSGTINPVAGIGRLAAAHGAYLLVDAVSSFGGMDVDPDTCHADLFVTGPNKCLGCPPGLSLVGVTPRAWEKMKKNPTAPRDSILSYLDWEHAARRDRPFPFTPSVAELHGLAAALDLYLDEGPQAVWARHAASARVCRAGIRAMALSLWPATDDIASPTCTVVRLPLSVPASAVLTAARALGVVLAPGRGDAAGRVVRIGHMGPMAEPLLSVLAVTVLARSLQQCGFDCDAGRAAQAALEAMPLP